MSNPVTDEPVAGEAATDASVADQSALASASASAGRHRSLLPLAAAVMVATIIIDQITKAIALGALEFGQPIGVFWTLEWELTYNTGSAFSLGAGESLGAIIGVIAIIISGVVLAMSRSVAHRGVAILLGMVAGGALGNVIDRLFRAGNCGPACDGFMGGGVVDFIDFNWWPIFNVADMCIVVGAIALVLFGLRGDL